MWTDLHVACGGYEGYGVWVRVYGVWVGQLTEAVGSWCHTTLLFSGECLWPMTDCKPCQGPWWWAALLLNPDPTTTAA
jgi:hypothetical protein